MSGGPEVKIELDGEGRAYQPGETLSGRYWVESLQADSVKAIEASVLWYTEGKGDEDMAVHVFFRRDAEREFPFDLRRPERFSTLLPNTPLSYEGQIIKLRWIVRVRVLLHRGKNMVGEKGFQLGNVPPAAAHHA
ncbi:MAG: hypothetical protein JW959_13915 [Pirellulales bacterium]|nr:hypothetical protein [Pirellulales bacterium]